MLSAISTKTSIQAISRSRAAINTTYQTSSTSSPCVVGADPNGADRPEPEAAVKLLRVSGAIDGFHDLQRATAVVDSRYRNFFDIDLDLFHSSWRKVWQVSDKLLGKSNARTTCYLIYGDC